MSITDTYLAEKIASLEAAILTRTPNLPILLDEIKKAILRDPDQVTIASEEEIATIVEGLKLQTQITISASVSKAATAKKLKNLTVEDL